MTPDSDGALGFWAAAREVWPETRAQGCWCHKLVNVLDKLPHFSITFSIGGVLLPPGSHRGRVAHAEGYAAFFMTSSIHNFR